MEEIKSKVYVKLDEENNIIEIRSDRFILSEELENWIFIDEGDGDRYAHADSQYFPDGLFIEDGEEWKYRYKLIDGQIIDTHLEEDPESLESEESEE